MSTFDPDRNHLFFDGSRRGSGRGTWGGSGCTLANGGGGGGFRGATQSGVTTTPIPLVLPALLHPETLKTDCGEEDGEDGDDGDEDNTSANGALLVSNVVQDQFANNAPLRTALNQETTSNYRSSPTKSETSVAADNCRKKRLQLAPVDPSGCFGMSDPDPDLDDDDEIFLPAHLITFRSGWLTPFHLSPISSFSIYRVQSHSPALDQWLL